MSNESMMPRSNSDEVDEGRRNFLKGGAALTGAAIAGIETSAMAFAFAYDSYTNGAEAAEKKTTFVESVKAAIADEKNDLKKILNMAIKENQPKVKVISGSWSDVDAYGKKVMISSMTFSIVPDEEFGAVMTISFKGRREGGDKVELLGSAVMKSKKEEKATK